MHYSGYNWVNHVRKGNFPTVSNLGKRAANVLGQVFGGLHHLPLRTIRSVLWEDASVIEVRIDREMATYDENHLTRLLLCCEAAEIFCGIAGMPFGGTRLIFSPRAKFTRFDSETHERRLRAPLFSEISEFAEVKKHLRNPHPGSDFYLVENLGWIQLADLFDAAHRESIRVSLKGRSQYSLELGLHQREQGSQGSQLPIYARHPTLAQHRDILQELVNIDYLEN